MTSQGQAKLGSLLFFMVCLVGAADAIEVDGEFRERGVGLQSTAIAPGETSIFAYRYATVDPPSTITVELYDPNDNLIFSWHGREHDEIKDSKFISLSGDLTTVLEGTYGIKIVGEDSSGDTDEHVLNLEVVGDRDTEAPAVEILAPLSSVRADAIRVLRYEVSDDSRRLARCWYTINGEAVDQAGVCTGRFDIPEEQSKEGLNVWTVHARDMSGNEASDTVRFFVRPAGQLTVFAHWNQSLAAQSAVLDDGDRAAFLVDVASVTTLRSIDIGLYRHTMLVHAVEGVEPEGKHHRNIFVLDEGTYGGPGDYVVRIAATDETGSRDEHTLNLKVTDRRGT